jgi:sialate O-acetylesterase
MKLHGYFKDGAVLQAGYDVIVKGAGAPARPVEITVVRGGRRASFVSVSNERGEFSVNCGAYEAGFGEYAFTVRCGEEERTFSRVLFGDVYLAMGQSNLELRLKYLYGYNKIIANCKRQKFRFLDVENTALAYNGKGIYGLAEEAEDFIGQFAWRSANEKNAAENTFGFSYLFCAEMQRKTGYPVAAINVAVGGSGFANWLPREAIERNPVLASAYAQTLEEDETGQVCAGCIYNEKISPLKGFAFKGAIWYLGESAAWDGFGSTSAVLPALETLIPLYRSVLRGNLPVVIMDIGIQSYGRFSVNYANEQFSYACKKIENLVQCPIYDLSHRWIRADGNTMYHPIHLIEKNEHARRAVTLFYENFVSGRGLHCPEIENVRFENGSAVCTVAHADTIISSDGKPLYGFALAGKDGGYVPARAVSDGNEIIVSSPFVAEPERLTYAFFQYNDACNATNGTLPLLPYRSRFENADELPYADLPQSFACRYGQFYENAFSALGGGAGFRPCFTAGKLFGDPNVKITCSAKGVLLKMRYCPQEACFVGVSPEISVANQPHGLDRFDKLCLELTAQKPLELTGIHFRTCEGEQFYLVPEENGAEARNMLLPRMQTTRLTFRLDSAADRKENTFVLSLETRKKICAMQITFRNYEANNEVLISEITPYYDGAQHETRTTDSRDKMYCY